MKLADRIIKRKLDLSKFDPCPFCGGTWIEVQLTEHEGAYRIKCQTCNANRFAVTKYAKQLNAEWNNRAKK